MTPPRPAAEWQRLTVALLHVTGADSVEAVLTGAAALMAGMAGAETAAAFTIEGDRVRDEGWFPGPATRSDPIGERLRAFALDAVRAGAPIARSPGDPSPGTVQLVPLRAQHRTLGAVALVRNGTPARRPAPHERLEQVAAVVSEAVLRLRRDGELRATSEQQKRWFGQLDHQVRVLDRERQKFAAVVNQSDTYAFVVDPTSTIRWVNRTMSLERPPSGDPGWPGRGCRDACSTLASAAGACHSCPVARALETNHPVHHELRGTVGDRSKTFYVTALPIRGVEGRPQEVLVMMQDLSDLEALRESEERYRVVTQAASDGIVTIDESGTILFVNEALQNIFGYTHAELLGRPLTLLMPAALAERHRNALQAYVTTHTRRMSWQGIQLPAIRRDGREITVEMSFGEYVKEGKRLFTGVIRDITDRRRAELELKRAQEQLRMVVSNAPIVLFAIDGQGTFTLSEGRGLESLGLSPGEAVGRSAFELYQDVPQIVANLRRALAGEAFADVVDVGPIGFETRYTPLRDDAGAVVGVIGVATDVTQRRRLEDQLRQSQKMEALGRLAGGVAHDFNNLLTTVLGHSSLLLNQHDAPVESERCLLEIKRAAERAAGLTRQLLAFSRHQVLEPRVSDLNRVVGDMGNMLSRLIGEDIELAFAPASEPALVRVDPHQLEQVVMNLAVNSRDAMPRGGRLTIEIARGELPEALTQGDVTLAAGACVVLTVSDTGCGMDAASLARVFEPFFTSKAFGHGTGLGLAIVYGIVQQVGGHIAVESEPGKGARFTLRFPTAMAEPLARPAARVQRSSGGTETLLLVEDEPPVRALARDMLAGLGYTVLDAASGAEALKLAAGHAGAIDMVITDVVMPGMSGGEMVERLLASRPSLRVLYMSGYTDDAIVRHGVSHATSAFLQKPFTYEAFVTKVRETLDRPAPGHASPAPEATSEADDPPRAA